MENRQFHRSITRSKRTITSQNVHFIVTQFLVSHINCHTIFVFGENGLFHYAYWFPLASILLPGARFQSVYDWVVFHSAFILIFLYASVDRHVAWFHVLAIVLYVTWVCSCWNSQENINRQYETNQERRKKKQLSQGMHELSIYFFNSIDKCQSWWSMLKDWYNWYNFLMLKKLIPFLLCFLPISI